jgi:putative phage-type endonuclease
MTQAWLKVPEMTPEQWLDWRDEGVGGSDAPAIMGVSPWATYYQKWEEKVLKKRQGDNASKKFGRDTEEASRREYEDLVGLRMPATYIQNTKESWLRASLDGMSLDGKRLLEIKKANKEDHALALQGKIPDKYYPQCQHILKVHGNAEAIDYFSSPADGSPGKIVEIARNDHYIDQELYPKETQFWDQVRNNKAPALTDRDYLDMEKNKRWLESSQKWKETNQLLREFEFKEKQLREELIALSKDHNAKGNNVTSMVQGRIDYMKAFDDYIDNMKSHYPEIDFRPISLDPYRKESFVKWTLRGMS